MSIFPRQVQWNKHCLVYCGPERCNCGASASPFERAKHEAELRKLEALAAEKVGAGTTAPEGHNAELSGPRPLAAEGSRSNAGLAGRKGER